MIRVIYVDAVPDACEAVCDFCEAACPGSRQPGGTDWDMTSAQLFAITRAGWTCILRREGHRDRDGLLVFRDGGVLAVAVQRLACTECRKDESRLYRVDCDCPPLQEVVPASQRETRRKKK